MDRIYATREEALEACREFNSRLEALMTELGTWIENDDSCSENRTYAQYYDGMTVRKISL